MGTAKDLVGTMAGPLVRRLTRRASRVLMYHRFGSDRGFRRLQAAVFERQVTHLKLHFRPIKLDELANRLREGRAPPENSVVVTVDDGYADFCRLAAPILEKHGIPATFFVVSDFIDRKLWLWYDAIHYLVHASSLESFRLTLDDRQETLRLGGRLERDSLWERLADDLLPLPMDAKYRRIRELAGELDVILPEVPTLDYEAATWDDLRRLDARLFDVGSHTKSHAILSRCEPKELHVELEQSRRSIEDHLERDVRSFCYPNGQRDDYDEACIRAVQAAGYQCAVVAYGGLVRSTTDPFRIERLSPSPALSAFRRQMDGVSDLRSHIVGALGHPDRSSETSELHDRR